MTYTLLLLSPVAMCLAVLCLQSMLNVLGNVSSANPPSKPVSA